MKPLDAQGTTGPLGKHDFKETPASVVRRLESQTGRKILTKEQYAALLAAARLLDEISLDRRDHPETVNAQQKILNVLDMLLPEWRTK